MVSRSLGWGGMNEIAGLFSVGFLQGVVRFGVILHHDSGLDFFVC